ncbi:MAG: hypothetical protein IPP99_08385 [Chitinophagaceae bacterium]|nr:hypothetical protein [Chitinophagaceae bacterium]
MKRNLLVLLLIVNAIVTTAQTKQKMEWEDEINAKKSGDDKASFSSILNALGKFTSQDGSAITFNPTLYGLASLFNPGIKKQEKFRDAIFLRNFQLNLGFTPSEESIFKVDDFQSGFSYAFLNNKKLTAADYQQLSAAEPARRMELFLKTLNQFIVENETNKEGISAKEYRAKILSKDEKATMTSALQSFLMKQLGVQKEEELKEMAFGHINAFKNKLTELSKRTSLTFDFKSTYSFADKQWGELSFTPVNLYCYFNKSKLSSPGLNATLSYVLGTDTSTKQALKRRTIETEVGMNFPIKVNPETEKAAFEIKPGISYKYITARVYRDEKKSQFDPTLTFRIRINDDFYLPLKLEYDTENAELFGFLSIQFSLN